MNERLSLQINDFLIEGRDEEKSHVILEIAKPVPEELLTHGHFIALAEMAGATPKTINMVRAWVEFAIDAFYGSVPSNLEQHFEDLLQRLNTQSSLYLKQHPETQLHMAILAIRGTDVLLSFHGAPSVLLLYRKQDSWHSMNLAEADAAPAALFSNVLTGTLRPGDRMCLASGRVIEFFSADRIAKLCETKSTAEVAEHMARILNDLAADVSFAGACIELEKIIEPEPEAELPARVAEAPQKKSIHSMKELLQKTTSTESLLSPPVISISKDKVVTDTLRIVQRGAVAVGRVTVGAIQSTATFTKRSTPHVSRVCRSTWQHVHKFLDARAPNSRKNIQIGVGAIAAILLIGGGVLFYRSHAAGIAADRAALAEIQNGVQAADGAITFQNSSRAIELITTARSQFNLLSKNAQSGTDGVALEASITNEELKIYRVTPVAFEQVAPHTDATQIAVVRSTPFTLSVDGALSTMRNGALTAAISVPAKTNMLFDPDGDRLLFPGLDGSIKAVASRTMVATDLKIDHPAEQTHFDAMQIYSGRLYVYDSALQKIYRYDKTPTGFGNGTSWIKDSGKPMGVTALQADTSLWMLTNVGALLKYTAGKAQLFHPSGAVPELQHIDSFQLGGGSNNLYILDHANNRIAVLDRSGALVKQYRFPAGSNLRAFDIDDKETTIFGISDDGKLIKFAVSAQ